MAKYDKKSALQIIVNAAKEYDAKLNDKHFISTAILFGWSCWKTF